MSEKKTMSSCRQVVQIRSGKIVNVFDSIRGMCIELGVDRRAVIRVLNNEPNFRSVKGWEFEYVSANIPVENYVVGEVFDRVINKYK